MPLTVASISTRIVCAGRCFEPGQKGILQPLSWGQFKTISDLPEVCCVDAVNQSILLFTPFIGDKTTFDR